MIRGPSAVSRSSVWAGPSRSPTRSRKSRTSVSARSRSAGSSAAGIVWPASTNEGHTALPVTATTRCRPAWVKVSTLTSGPSRYCSASGSAPPSRTNRFHARSASSAPSTRTTARLADPFAGLRTAGPPMVRQNAASAAASPGALTAVGLSPAPFSSSRIRRLSLSSTTVARGLPRSASCSAASAAGTRPGSVSDRTRSNGSSACAAASRRCRSSGSARSTGIVSSASFAHSGTGAAASCTSAVRTPRSRAARTSAGVPATTATRGAPEGAAAVTPGPPARPIARSAH